MRSTFKHVENLNVISYGIYGQLSVGRPIGYSITASNHRKVLENLSMQWTDRLPREICNSHFHLRERYMRLQYCVLILPFCILSHLLWFVGITTIFSILNLFDRWFPPSPACLMFSQKKLNSLEVLK